MPLIPAIPVLAGIAALGSTAAVVTHPDPEALAHVERPARAVKPVARPLRTSIVKPLNTGIAQGGVMHPAPDCAAPDRGFNPLYAAAAHSHAPNAPHRFGCDVHAQAERESNQKPDARSPAGALGMMQFLPATAREFGIDPLVPAEAVDGAARYLRWLERRFPHVSAEDLPKFVHAAYNWGVGNVRRTGCATWTCLKPLLPTETRVYVRGIEVMARDGTWYREKRG
ncbi:MAG: lytic transglycosylase domain-containing protein [Alphaproteobacteria bacterium]|nr:lytic transglycosylase domain-containing protein [Alphaproteobacteria bacterium]